MNNENKTKKLIVPTISEYGGRNSQLLLNMAIPLLNVFMVIGQNHIFQSGKMYS